MILFDVNVLVYATDSDAVDHVRYRDWLIQTINGSIAFGSSDLVLSSFVRIATNRRILAKPLTLDQAFEVTRLIRGRSNCVTIQPGPRHWELFAELSVRANAKGNLVTDAYLAALSIEAGCEWISTDRDYARFPGLRWRHPLDE